MRRLPPEPQVGDRITAELIRELIRCIRERQLIKGPNYALQTGPTGTYLKLDLPSHRQARDKPLPFEVRWDATLNNGEGGYKIYLPTEHLLSYGGTYINTSDISGATPIPDANGDDTAWSVLDVVDTSADHVWLVVTIPDEGDVSAEFAAAEGQSVTGSLVLNVCIAEVSYEASEEEGGSPKIEIKQSVVGALCLGGGGGGGEPPAITPGPFNPLLDAAGELVGFEMCYWQGGGKTYFLPGVQQYVGAAVPEGRTGFVALRVRSIFGAIGDASLQGYATFDELQAAQEDMPHFVVPLYYVEADKIKLDLRAIPFAQLTEAYQ